MKILVTGVNGQVGHALMHELSDHETKRPKNSILNNAKIKQNFNLELHCWDTELEKLIDEA